MSNSILILQARFYAEIADELLAGAVEILQTEKVSYEIQSLPGVFEIPAALSMAVDSLPHKHTGFIALGCVIRGETTHYDYVCSESARGLNQLAMQHSLALGYGILTVENESQAWARANRNKGNKGKQAAQACLHMINLKDIING